MCKKSLVADKLIVGGLITGLSVALAFFICTSIVLSVLAVYLYQRSSTPTGTVAEVTSEVEEENMDYYVLNYYDSIK